MTGTLRDFFAWTIGGRLGASALLRKCRDQFRNLWNVDDGLSHRRTLRQLRGNDGMFHRHYDGIGVSDGRKSKQVGRTSWANTSINNSHLDGLFEKVPPEVMACRGQLSIDDRLLYYWAGSDFYKGVGTVVDCGALVGATTTALAVGLQANPIAHRAGARPIHVYDVFEDAWDGYSARLIREWYGEELPAEVYDFESHFQRNTKFFSELLDVHRGDITKIGYRDQRDIEVLSIDVAKTPDLMHRVATEFFPRLMPGRAIVLHQDYLFCFQPWLVIAMELMDDLFERIYDVPTQCTSVFVPRQRITASQVRQRLGEDGAAYYHIENAGLIERAANRSLTWRARVHLTAAASYFHLEMGNLQTAQMMAVRMIQQFDLSRRLIESTELKDLFVHHLHLDLNRIC